MLLISDANIIIDMEVAELTEAMFELPHEFAVPNALYDEELHPACEPLIALGLQIHVLPGEVIATVAPLRAAHPRLSANDLFAMVLARHLNCPLLTGDRHLREAAAAQQLQIYGTLWLMAEMFREGVLNVQEVEEAYALMRTSNRRLPWDDVELQLQQMREA
jgi:predicted nucleic acid-binding protein